MVIFSEKLKEKSIPFLLHPKLVVVVIGAVEVDLVVVEVKVVVGFSIIVN